MAYNTPDGLRLKFGTEKATPTTAGEYRQNGKYHEVEFEVTLANLTETETILDDVTMIPDNVRIQEVEVITLTAAVTGTAIDVGFIRADRTTEEDYNGLIAALTTAEMNADGERQLIEIGHSKVGADVGTTVTNGPLYVSASRTDSTAFTAGVLRITIRYYVP
jgi:hypothetical protein